MRLPSVNSLDSLNIHVYSRRKLSMSKDSFVWVAPSRCMFIRLSGRYLVYCVSCSGILEGTGLISIVRDLEGPRFSSRCNCRDILGDVWVNTRRVLMSIIDDSRFLAIIRFSFPSFPYFSLFAQQFTSFHPLAACTIRAARNASIPALYLTP